MNEKLKTMTSEEVEQRFMKGIEMFNQGASQPAEPELRIEALGWRHANLAQTEFEFNLKIGDRVKRIKGTDTEGVILDFWQSEGHYSTLHNKQVGQGVKAKVKWNNKYTSKVNLSNLMKC